MTIKTSYEVGDAVWIYGISSIRNNITQGRVVHKLEIPGFTETHYIISIPTEIEPLLEVRTWHNISQDEYGPIGAFRGIKDRFESTKKYIAKTGFSAVESNEESAQDEEPTEAEIHAALEKSRTTVQHQPLVLKDAKPKRRSFPRKKKA